MPEAGFKPKTVSLQSQLLIYDVFPESERELWDEYLKVLLKARLKKNKEKVLLIWHLLGNRYLEL